MLSSRDLELPFYSFAIRVKPDKDLFAELEAIWAKAILKWSQVFEVLGFPGQLGDAVDAELHFLLQRIRVQCSEMLLVSSRQGLL